DLPQTAAAREDAWIAAQHPVHISPDLDLIGRNSRAYQRGCQVGSAPPERGRGAAGRRSDKSAHNNHAVARQQPDGPAQACVGVPIQWLRVRELAAGDDDFARVYLRGVDAQMAERLGHDQAGKPLAVAQHLVLDLRRELAAGDDDFARVYLRGVDAQMAERLGHDQAGKPLAVAQHLVLDLRREPPAVAHFHQQLVRFAKYGTNAVAQKRFRALAQYAAGLVE